MGKENQKAFENHSGIANAEEISGFSNEVVDFRFIITQQVFQCMRMITNAWNAEQIEMAATAVNVFEVSLKSCFNEKQLEHYATDLKDLDTSHENNLKLLKLRAPTERLRKRYSVQKLGILLRYASALGLTFTRGVTDTM